MRSLSKLMDEAVREQGGFVRGFTGDGIMAAFGAPVALEDAPLRSCRAALNILQRLKTAGPDLEAKHGMCPQLRIGLTLALLDKNPDCASDDQIIEFLASYMHLLNVTAQVKVTIGVLERYLRRVDRFGDDPRAVIVRSFYVFALIFNARYREAAAVQRETSPIADRLGDSRSKACALAGEIWVTSTVAPKPLHEFETLKRLRSTCRQRHCRRGRRWSSGHGISNIGFLLASLDLQVSDNTDGNVSEITHMDRPA